MELVKSDCKRVSAEYIQQFFLGSGFYDKSDAFAGNSDIFAHYDFLPVYSIHTHLVSQATIYIL